jgi:hypothetical protein
LCGGVTKTGEPCQRHPGAGNVFCYAHRK